MADLSRARPLFASRRSRTLEDFLYVPQAIVVSPAVFARTVVPALRAQSAALGGVVRSGPVEEVDVRVERGRLRANPAEALAQTRAVARAVDRIAPGQDYLIDNISNALGVARADAAVGKRMFLFLGLPAVLLAATLAAYAGGVLAAAQRREQANLRLRGAQRGQLLRMLAYRTLALAGAGSLIGAAAGFLAVLAILGSDALLKAAPADLARSALAAAGGGLLVTGLALFIPGQRSLAREIARERRELAIAAPALWWRLRLDLVLLAGATLAEVIAVRSGALHALPGSVFAGRSVELPSRLLLVPLLAWAGGVLLCAPPAARARDAPAAAGAAWLRRPGRRPSEAQREAASVGARRGRRRARPRGRVRDEPARLHRHLRRGQAGRRALRRRLRSAHLGRRVRRTAVHAAARRRGDRPDAGRLQARELRRDRHLQARHHGSGGDRPLDLRQCRAALGLLVRRPLAERGDGRSARRSAGRAARRGDRRRALARARRSRADRARPGNVARDHPRLPRGRPVHALHRLRATTEPDRRAAGLQGGDDAGRASTSCSPARLITATGAWHGRSPHSARRAERAARSRSRRSEAALGKDQSSLTALHVRGLVDLGSLFTLLMCAAVLGVFMFGLLLQRRREYVVLRAQGMHAREVRSLVLGEAALVATGGLASGLLVGAGSGFLLVQVLRPLFIVPPAFALPAGALAVLVLAAVAAALASAFAGLAVLRRISPTEILREQ